jgi:hypothetical protein
VHLWNSPSDVDGLAGSGAAEQSPPAASGRAAPNPASAGDQASAKGEDLRRAVIGTMGAPAQEQTDALEACLRSW